MGVRVTPVYTNSPDSSRCVSLVAWVNGRPAASGTRAVVVEPTAISNPALPSRERRAGGGGDGGGGGRADVDQQPGVAIQVAAGEPSERVPVAGSDEMGCFTG